MKPTTYNPTLAWNKNSNLSKMNYANQLSSNYFQYLPCFENLTICIDESPQLNSFLKEIINNEKIYNVIDGSQELRKYLDNITKQFNNSSLGNNLNPIFQNISIAFGNIATHFEKVI